MYTIVVGNPWDGMSLWGVFSTFDEAENLAYNLFSDREWWIKEIEYVAKEETW